MNPAVREQRAGSDVEGVKPFADKCCRGCIDLAVVGGVENVDFQPDRTSRSLYVVPLAIGRWISRINKQPHTPGRRDKLMQDSQPLCSQLRHEKIDTGYVTAWPGEARDKTKLDRVFGNIEY